MLQKMITRVRQTKSEVRDLRLGIAQTQKTWTDGLDKFHKGLHEIYHLMALEI